MNILLIGTGVIGSVYGGQAALAGHQVWVLSHGDREKMLALQGIRLHDEITGLDEIVPVEVAKNANERKYDLIIVAVQAGQLASTFPALFTVSGAPHIIIFGNNPDGHAAIPSNIPGSIELAFPGIGGSIKDGVVEFVRIAEQPTMFEAGSNEQSRSLQSALEFQGFKLQRTVHIDGWLAYHAVFICCISTALLKSDIDPIKLGNDSKLLHLMCRAIEEGFRSLKSQGVKGLPLNLKVLHFTLFRPIATRYWGRILRSSKGELYFAGHVHHAPNEILTLSQWVIKHVVEGYPNTHNLRILIEKNSPY